MNSYHRQQQQLRSKISTGRDMNRKEDKGKQFPPHMPTRKHETAQKRTPYASKRKRRSRYPQNRRNGMRCRILANPTPLKYANSQASSRRHARKDFPPVDVDSKFDDTTVGGHIPRILLSGRARTQIRNELTASFHPVQGCTP